ncbi:stromal processing peptidase, chloroplastic-like [Humulus lupulus]|uniref:stromal processing peptidase, chloroplastic-like n=1 Tax=Humulus lupulus TaxID=3486 RepID=UPI002B403DAA|nr:stromal processing peptidase, chloroplastic-like [Humulus lupulus]
MLALFQVHRLKEFGVTKGELTRYLDALLKDSEHLAAMIDNVSSVDNLDFIMESDALGHTVIDQRQGHESLVTVAGTIKLEEVYIEMHFFSAILDNNVEAFRIKIIFH